MYKRVQIATIYGRKLMATTTSSLGTFYWFAYEGADRDLYPFGNRTFDTLTEARDFADERWS